MATQEQKDLLRKRLEGVQKASRLGGLLIIGENGTEAIVIPRKFPDGKPVGQKDKALPSNGIYGLRGTRFGK